MCCCDPGTHEGGVGSRREGVQLYIRRPFDPAVSSLPDDWEKVTRSETSGPIREGHFHRDFTVSSGHLAGFSVQLTGDRASTLMRSRLLLIPSWFVLGTTILFGTAGVFRLRRG